MSKIFTIALYISLKFEINAKIVFANLREMKLLK